MDYQWCHGPFCHQRRTTSRVRGVKGSKVLRTIKIKQDRVSIWNYFCDHTCMNDFIVKHIDEFAQLHPRTEALETPIEDPKKVKLYENANWHTWEIKEVDNNPNP
tara:strand:- start:14 stop:328 length:315 start_codon:yes stop_codon:yes gene_type:complete